MAVVEGLIRCLGEGGGGLTGAEAPAAFLELTRAPPLKKTQRLSPMAQRPLKPPLTKAWLMTRSIWWCASDTAFLGWYLVLGCGLVDSSIDDPSRPPRAARPTSNRAKDGPTCCKPHTASCAKQGQPLKPTPGPQPPSDPKPFGPQSAKKEPSPVQAHRAAPPPART
jgi:hypothetical protein